MLRVPNIAAGQAGPAKSIAPAAHPSTRLLPLDTIRAVALFGVVVMNTLAVTMVVASEQVMASASAVDMAVAIADFVLLQGKARGCFALLFGIGFGMLLRRMPEQGALFPGVYMRRLAALFLFGLANQVFLFWGDILSHYAVLGAALPFCRRWHDRTLLYVGGALILLPPLVFGLATLVLGHPLPNLAGAAPDPDYARASAGIYMDGSYWDVVSRNLMFQPRAYLYDSFHRAEYDLSLLGLFLLGFLAARKEMPIEIARNRPTLRTVAIWCVPVGAAISLIHLAHVMKLTDGAALRAIGMAAFSGPSILALGLVAAAALWLSRAGLNLQRWLAPAGRMALTNYLLAGGLASWITYGYGLGLLGRMNLAALTLLGTAIYLLLAALSIVWLRSFRFGPAEWILRSATFARLQPMRLPHSPSQVSIPT